MKVTKRKVATFILGIFLILSLGVVSLIVIPTTHTMAATLSTANNETQLDIIDYQGNKVDATYEFVKINDEECGVRITNNSEATTAVIPEVGIINGKEYTVTEIAEDGFADSENLKFVKLLSSIKKIGDMAFAYCSELQYVDLCEAEELGDSAFYNCPELDIIIIPNSVKVVGPNLFRNNNTQIEVRSTEQGCLDWDSDWNLRNSNQDVHYESKVRRNMKAELIYNNLTKSGNTINGLMIIDGNSGLDNIASVNPDNFDGENIIIPNYYIYNNISYPILAIGEYAFESKSFDNLIIEYSEKTLYIDSRAFVQTKSCSGKDLNVIINRPVEFVSYNDKKESNNIFLKSKITNIILPEGCDIVSNMFKSCTSLKNIFFQNLDESNALTKDELKTKLKNLVDQNSTGTVEIPSSVGSIGDSAFAGATSITRLELSGDIKNVGATIISGWNEITQTVYVENETRIHIKESNDSEGWHPQWMSTFSKVDYKNQFYQISFVLNTGSEDDNAALDPMDVVYNEAIPDLPSPDYPNLDVTFSGWFDEESGKKYNSGDKFDQQKDITLKAKWECTIKYIKNNIVMYTDTFAPNQITYLRDFYTPSGYEGKLKDIRGTAEYNFSFKFTVTENTTLIIDIYEQPLSKCYGYASTPSSGYWYSIYGPNQLCELRDKVNNGSIKPQNVRIMDNIYLNDPWIPFDKLDFVLDGQGYTITFKNENVNGDKSYGFILEFQSPGWIKNINFKAKIRTSVSSVEGQNVGVVAAYSSGSMSDVQVLAYNKDNSYIDYNNNNVDVLVRNVYTNVGGIAGIGYNSFQNCINRASIAGCGFTGGIVGFSSAYIGYCKNYGNLYYDHYGVNGCTGGIVGCYYDDGSHSCINNYNYGTIYFAKITDTGSGNKTPCMGQIAGYERKYTDSSNFDDCTVNGNVIFNGINSEYLKYVSNKQVGYCQDKESGGGGSCITSGTYITLADGSMMQVQDLTGNEKLLVWNMFTGTFDVAPILFIDSDSAEMYEVINLYFSDGTEVEVISEHAFWDFDLNQYVFLRNDASKYIGHWFNKQTQINGEFTYSKVQLVDVTISEKYTMAWSPVTYGHLCYYVNGMLSMPGATEGLINIFNVDAETMRYDETSFIADIETYGLFTYEEFNEYLSVSYEVFEAFGGQYLKVSIGKGLINFETLADLLNRYSDFL